ncbi:hypothetical protein L6164_024407 [Bauhinia variegata]|uniref:Uncharacterized protein n=1 Tax=Bauhinia variegata TaxID=167791 RepID=A0ACB9LYV6_BAUVA|nr:hypothetical protein L6164_024407 [Bauhinia variegata]
MLLTTSRVTLSVSCVDSVSFSLGITEESSADFLIDRTYSSHVHFFNRDSLGLANDFLSSGFIPEEVDIHSVSEALHASSDDRTSSSMHERAILTMIGITTFVRWRSWHQGSVVDSNACTAGTGSEA